MGDTPWTPGPWVLEILNGYDSFDNPVECDVEITAVNGEHIHSHDLGYRDDTDAEIKANARLIAAAPDMAEALRLFLEYDSTDTDDVQTMLAYADALAAAKAAYAKAKGATP